MSSTGATIAVPARGRIDAVLRARGLRPVFQPLIDLQTGTVVGYESLIRGPRGSLLETPEALFAAAREEGRLGELDALCRQSAFGAAAAAGLGGGDMVFVNLEPTALAEASFPGTPAALQPPPGVRVVFEVSEQALVSDPAAILASAGDLRRRGFGIALDDVGADSRALALMPLLRPDVIKLDLRLVQERPAVETARVLLAVSAEAERTGAAVVAEAVEVPGDVGIARSVGATLAQGFHFGRPALLPGRGAARARGVRLLEPQPAGAGRTPFEILLLRDRPVRRAAKPLLQAISRSFELEATALGQSAILIASFQDRRHFTTRVRQTYRTLGRWLAFTGVLGIGLSGEPEPGVRGAELGPTDPLQSEWDVAVVSPHFAATLAAWDVGDTGPERERRFDFAVSHDRDLSIEAARSMMLRMTR